MTVRLFNNLADSRTKTGRVRVEPHCAKNPAVSTELDVAQRREDTVCYFYPPARGDFAWSANARSERNIASRALLPAISRHVMSDFEQARQHFTQGLAAIDARDWDTAEKAFLASLAIVPARPSTLGNLAIARLQRGIEKFHRQEFNAAILDFDGAIEANPSLADAYSNKGLALAALDAHHTALESFDHALGIRPQDATTLSNKGLSLFALTRTEEAAELFSRAVELNPTLAEAWNNRGLAMINSAAIIAAAATS